MEKSIRNATFKDELTNLINRYSMENDSNTPDFVISEYLMNCLTDFNRALNIRDNWNGSNTIKEMRGHINV